MAFWSIKGPIGAVKRAHPQIIQNLPTRIVGLESGSRSNLLVKIEFKK